MGNATCPTCGTPVTQIKLREIEEQEQRRKSALETSINERLKETYRQRLEAAKQAAEKQAKVDAGKRLVTITLERDKVLKKVKELEARESDVRKKAAEEAERRVKQIQTEAARRSQKELADQRQVLDKHRDQEMMKQQVTFTREREALQKKVKEMERKLLAKTSNQLGDGAEIDLYEALREAFPDDRIKRVQKGTAGADIIHEIINRGQVCGRIVYDSKNHQGWRDEWVPKLRQDQAKAEAQQAILSTLAFPSGQKEVCLRDGVIVINPVHVVSVVRVLRGSIITIHQLGLSSKEREGKMSRLYAFITSESFARRLKTAAQLTGKILDLDVKEKKEHDSVWKQRGLLTNQLTNVVVEIETEISTILEGVDMRPAA